MDKFQYEPPEGLKKLTEQLRQISEQSREWLLPIQETIQKYNAVLQPIIDASKQVEDRFKQITASISVPDSLKVVSKMKESQYVYWDYLTSAFIDGAINSIDFEMFLLDYESRDNYKSSERLISECDVHPFLQQYKVLFSQAIKSYRNEQYNIASTGITAIIDAVLSEATQNPTHKPKERCNAILDKLMVSDDVADEEYATLTLFMTFNAMVKSFYESIPFSNLEPSFLNRNWIMHGRIQREMTRLDCIKLLRFLYGIILIDYIDVVNPNNDTD